MIQRSRTILIVDNCSEDRETYRRYLLCDCKYSYTFLETSLGYQGLDLWQDHQPDAVLLDYRLPDLNGLEFLSRLQSSTQQPCLPVLIVTRQGNEAIAVRAMKAGVQDYLIKEQLTPEALQLAVDGAIEAVQLRIQLQQRLDRERVVAQITRQIHQSLDLDCILQTTVTEVRQFLHTDRVLCFRLEPDGNGTVVAESVGAAWRSLFSSTIHDPCLAEHYLRFSRPESVTSDPAFVEDYVKRYRQGQVTAIADVQDGHIDLCHIELLAQFQVKANLVVPILQEDQLWGLLIAHHCTAPRSWQPLEIDLLKELATQMSIALRQAELYEQAQHELAERQQAEAALRESEERLRLALKASRMGTWDWNIQTGKITWSENLEALFGLEPGEFDGSYEMFVSRLHPDDCDRVQAAIHHAITTGEDYNIEFRVVYPNGYIRWALSQGKVFYDRDGQPLQMAGNDIDITERKRSEVSLRESEERFRQLAENIDAVFWLKETSENRVSYVSPAYEHLWGWQPQKLYANQQAWVDHIHPDDREWTAKAFQEKAASGQFDEEYRIVLDDGSLRWVHDRCFPLRDEAGKIYRFAGIAEDVTDRKRSEEALRKSEERFRTSVENMLDCFAIYRAVRNQQGEIVDFQATYINDAACLISQITREQHLERGLCELLPGHRDTGLFEEYCQVVETGQPLVKDSLIYEDAFGHQRLTKAFDIRVAKFGDGYVATWRDITDRKQTEEALRENEQLLRLALASSQAGSWDWEIQTGKIVWSPENFELYGLEPGNNVLQYEDWYNALHPEDRERANPEVACLIEQRLPDFRSEFRIIHPQRGIRWLLALGRLTFDEQGEPVRLSGINLDITDRKQTEQALQESEARLHLAHKATRSGLWDWDIIRNIARVSEEYCALLGFDSTTQEVSFEQWLSCVHLDDRASAIETVNRTLQQQQQYYEADYRILHPTGIRWIAARGQVFYDAVGNALRMLGNVQDITDRKQVEESLRQSEARYRTLFESMEDGFCVIEMVFDETNTPIDYRFLEVNPAFERQSGLGQAVGKTVRQLLPTLEDHWFETYGRVALSGEPVRFEQVSNVMNRWFDVYAFRVGQPESRKVAILFKEISDRKLAEQEREKLLAQEQLARTEAERANRIKDEFLAVLSHELRSPLNPILGWTKLLQTRSFDATATAQALATIERNAKLQTQLIDDLLDMAKILGGKLSVNSAPVNLVFVIESAIDTVRAAAVAKNILLYPVLPNIGQVSGDATRLQQIVWNLLSNAIKFTPQGGQVDLRLERVQNQAHIIVSDTGKGIDPKFLPYIFESFRQEDVSVTRRYGGLGLGLAIVRQLVEAHGGTITADSPGEGLGATFTVQLPLLRVEPEITQTNELLPQALDLTGLRVLAVDDEPDARELLAALLTQYGAEVLAVASAAEVLANLETFAPDVLVSDIGMPDVDGYTLMQQIRMLPSEKRGEIPAIALTAYAREDDSRQAFTSGYQRHVTKPLEPEQLVQAIVALVNSRLNPPVS